MDKVNTGDTAAVAVSLLRTSHGLEYIKMLQSFLDHIVTEGGVEPNSREWNLAADAFTNGFGGGLAFGTGMTLEDVERADD